MKEKPYIIVVEGGSAVGECIYARFLPRFNTLEEWQEFLSSFCNDIYITNAGFKEFRQDIQNIKSLQYYIVDSREIEFKAPFVFWDNQWWFVTIDNNKNLEFIWS